MRSAARIWICIRKSYSVGVLFFAYCSIEVFDFKRSVSVICQNDGGTSDFSITAKKKSVSERKFSVNGIWMHMHNYIFNAIK